MSDQDTTDSATPLTRIVIPEDCILPGFGRLLLSATFVDKALESMTEEEIRQGGSGQEPYASKLRQISCGRCNMADCPSNLNPRCQAFNPDPLFRLRYGQWHDRIERGEKLTEELKPNNLNPESFEIKGIYLASRRNPRIFITITRRCSGTKLELTIRVSEREFRIDESRYNLRSLEQVKALWNERIARFVA